MITEIAKCHENPEKSGGKVHWRWPLGKGRNRSDMDSHLVRSVSKSGWISTKCLKSGWISTECLRMDEFPFHYVSRGMEFPHADTCGLSSQGCHYMRIEFPKVSEFRMKLKVKLRMKLTKNSRSPWIHVWELHTSTEKCLVPSDIITGHSTRSKSKADDHIAMFHTIHKDCKTGVENRAKYLVGMDWIIQWLWNRMIHS